APTKIQVLPAVLVSVVPTLRGSQSKATPIPAAEGALKWMTLPVLSLYVIVPSLDAVAVRLGQAVWLGAPHRVVSIVPPPVRGSCLPITTPGSAVEWGGTVSKATRAVCALLLLSLIPIKTCHSEFSASTSCPVFWASR